MTRAGVGYVAMAAAGICAGALGYAVIWSYGEPNAPPVAMAAPPVQEAAPVATAPKPMPPPTEIAPASQAPADAVSTAAANSAPVAPKREPSRETATAPASA